MRGASWVLVLGAVLVLGVAGEENPEDVPQQETSLEAPETRIKRQGLGNSFILPTVNNFRGGSGVGGSFGNSRANQIINRPVQVSGNRGFSQSSSGGGLRVLNNDPLGLFGRQSQQSFGRQSFQQSPNVHRFQGGRVLSTTFPPAFQQQNQRFSQQFRPSQSFAGRQTSNQRQGGFQPSSFQFAQNIAQRQQAQAQQRAQAFRPSNVGVSISQTRPQASGFQGARTTGAQVRTSGGQGRPSAGGGTVQRVRGVLVQEITIPPTSQARPPVDVSQRPVGALSQGTRQQRPSSVGSRGPVGGLFGRTRPQTPNAGGARGPVGGLFQQTRPQTSAAGGARRPTGVLLQQTGPQTSTGPNNVQRASGVRLPLTGAQRPTGAQGIPRRGNTALGFFVDSREDSREFLFGNTGGRPGVSLPSLGNRGFQQNAAGFRSAGLPRGRPPVRLDFDLTEEDHTRELSSREVFLQSVLGRRNTGASARPQFNRPQVGTPLPTPQRFFGRPNLQVEVDVTHEDNTREFNSREIFFRNAGNRGGFAAATARPQAFRPNTNVQAFRSRPAVQIDVDVTEEDSREIFLQSIRNRGNNPVSRPLGRPAFVPNQNFSPRSNIQVEVDVTQEDLTTEINSREIFLNRNTGVSLPGIRPQTFRTNPTPQFARPNPTPQFNRPNPTPQFNRPNPTPQFNRPNPTPQPFRPQPRFQVEVDVTREDTREFNSREVILRNIGVGRSLSNAQSQFSRPNPTPQVFRPRPNLQVEVDLTQEDLTREINSREIFLQSLRGRPNFSGATARPQVFQPNPNVQAAIRNRPPVRVEFDLTQEDLTREFNSREIFIRPTGGRGRFQPGVTRQSSFRPVLQVDLTREDLDDDNTFELFDD